MRQIDENTYELDLMFDAHCHLRGWNEFGDPDDRAWVIEYTARQCDYAVAMPNLTPPLTTAAMAVEYSRRIVEHMQNNHLPACTPIVPLYITPITTPAMIREAHAAGIKAAKFYPAAGTTNSDAGVRDFVAYKMQQVLEAMQSVGMKALFHPAVADVEVDIFKRERKFIEGPLTLIREWFPNLMIGVEHMSTREAVEFVAKWALQGKTFGTITPQHLLYTRNDLLAGKLDPSAFCMPILQSDEDRAMLLKAALTRNNVFAGTDSAPHLFGPKDGQKGSAHCCPAGAFTAPVAYELYATAFERSGYAAWPELLERFMSRRGREQYSIPASRGKLILRREHQVIPEFVGEGDRRIPVLMGGKTIPFTACREL